MCYYCLFYMVVVVFHTVVCAIRVFIVVIYVDCICIMYLIVYRIAFSCYTNYMLCEIDVYVLCLCFEIYIYIYIYILFL